MLFVTDDLKFYFFLYSYNPLRVRVPREAVFILTMVISIRYWSDIHYFILRTVLKIHLIISRVVLNWYSKWKQFSILSPCICHEQNILRHLKNLRLKSKTFLLLSLTWAKILSQLITFGMSLLYLLLIRLWIHYKLDRQLTNLL